MAEVTTKKRKRTGKQREEAKKAAMAKAAAEAAGEGVDAGSSAEGAPGDDAGTAESKAVAEIGDASATVTEDSKPAVDFEKLSKRIPTALKKLHQLFKHAKREESQRLIKKIKFLSKKGASTEVDELDTQLKLLGAIDLHVLTANHLKLKLRKHYLLKRDGIPADVEAVIGGGQTVKASGSSATPEVIAKVENRLCSAKNVAEGVKGIVSWCLAEPGSTLNFEKMKEKKNKQSAKVDSDSESDNSASDGDDEREDDVPAVIGELDSDDEVVVQEKAAEAAGWESEDLEGEGSEDEDGDSEAEGGEDGWESGSVDGEGQGGEDAWIASASDSDAPDYAALANLKGAVTGSDSDSDSGANATSDSGSESDSSSGSSVAVERPAAKKVKADGSKKNEKPAKAEKKPEKKAAKAAKAEKPKPDGTSMFLPSLAAGFTAGDSDSDPDMDYDPDGVIGSKAAPRKNRRGQRARQAIWEKKYGKNAKHIVKQREEERKKAAKKEGSQRSGGFVPPSRDSGYKTYKPAPDSAPVLAKPGGSFGSSAPARTPSAAAGGPGGAGAGSAADEKKGKNHPSWEAARRRKEAEQKLKNAPKPTKIVFD